MDSAGSWLAARLGVTVKTVNWGYWGEQGIVATPEHRERMRRLGVGSIRAEEGIAVFERLLASDSSTVVAARLLRNPEPVPEAPVVAAPGVAPLSQESLLVADPD